MLAVESSSCHVKLISLGDKRSSLFLVPVRPFHDSLLAAMCSLVEVIITTTRGKQDAFQLLIALSSLNRRVRCWSSNCHQSIHSTSARPIFPNINRTSNHLSLRQSEQPIREVQLPLKAAQLFFFFYRYGREIIEGALDHTPPVSGCPFIQLQLIQLASSKLQTNSVHSLALRRRMSCSTQHSTVVGVANFFAGYGYLLLWNLP